MTKVRRIAVGILAATGLAVLTALATLDAGSDALPEGVRIAGVDVGGLDRRGAADALRAAAGAATSHTVTVTAAGARFIAPVATVGVVADVEAALDAAYREVARLGAVERLSARVRGTPVDVEVDLPLGWDDVAGSAFVDRVASSIATTPRSAKLAIVEGRLVVRPSRDGVALRVGEAAVVLRDAVARGATSVDLPVDRTAPRVASDQLGLTIVVDVSANTLMLFDGTDVARTYRVATGAPGYPTPLGSFEVVDKVEDPSWTNPDPEGWGRDYPAYIPPGPGNPLGTRALYLDAPGIRIHGTWSDSSIGTFASHGCIRMRIPESEELYPLVPVGTPVLIVA